MPANETVSRFMRANKNKNTGPEILLRKALWKAGVKGYRVNWPQLPGKPDLAFVRKRLAVFVNGCFWHRCPHCRLKLPENNRQFWAEKFARNQARDRQRTEALEKMGWNVLEIWECRLKKDVNRQVITVQEMLLKPIPDPDRFAAHGHTGN